MEKISTAIITFNEEQDLPGCLKSVTAFSDEILVVDSLSTDRTVAIARKAGARVVTQKFLGHVRQKQLAADKAKHDWVFSIDADERVTPELLALIMDLKRNGFMKDGYMVNRRNWYLTGWLRIGGWYPDRRIRLFNRKKAKWSGENPHDCVRMTSGARCGSLRADLLHYTYRNLSEHIRQIDKFSSASAKEKSAKGRTVSFLKLALVPVFSFLKTWIGRGGFKAGTRGLVVSTMSSFSDFAKYAKLWEIRHTNGQKTRK